MTAKAKIHTSTSSNGTGHADDKPISPLDAKAAKAILRASGGHRIAKRTRDEVLKHDEWGSLLQCVEDSAIERRRDAIDQWFHFQKSRICSEERAAEMRRAIMLSAIAVEMDPDEPEITSGIEPFRLNILGAVAFQRTTYKMEWVVRRALVAHQPGIVAAPKKALKTSTIVDLAVSLASGDPFLGHFEIPTPLEVLLLSGESGGFVIQDTMRRVCESKDLDPEILEGKFFVGFTLPQLSSQEHLDELARVIRENKIKVVLIDPLYLCLISGGGRRIDAANLFDMGPLFSSVAKACLDAGATPILIHHFRKGSTLTQHDEPELEDMAFAGIQEFARQWILLGRRKKFEPGSGLHELWLKVGGSAGHSGLWALDVHEGVMTDDFRGRVWRPSVRPAEEVRTAEKATDKADQAFRLHQAAKARDEAKAKQTEGTAVKALEVLRTLSKATTTQWRNALGLDGTRMGAAVFLLEQQAKIRKTVVEIPSGKSGTRPVEGWEPNPDWVEMPAVISFPEDPDEPY